MTLTIKLTPEEENRLEAIAKRQGIDLTQYARMVLGLTTAVQPYAPMTEAEWEQLEEELSEGIDPAIPPLSDEALSRDRIYGHRG